MNTTKDTIVRSQMGKYLVVHGSASTFAWVDSREKATVMTEREADFWCLQFFGSYKILANPSVDVI